MKKQPRLALEVVNPRTDEVICEWIHAKGESSREENDKVAQALLKVHPNCVIYNGYVAPWYIQLLVRTLGRWVARWFGGNPFIGLGLPRPEKTK